MDLNGLFSKNIWLMIFDFHELKCQHLLGEIQVALFSYSFSVKMHQSSIFSDQTRISQIARSRIEITALS